MMKVINRMDRCFVLALGLLILVANPGIYGEAESKLVPAVSPSISPSIFTSVLSSGWYEQTKPALEQQLKENFDIAARFFDVAVASSTIRAIIAPHAGYGFSGIAAAAAYYPLFDDKIKRTKNTYIKRVIVLAPSHHVAFAGVAIPDFTVYRTVLGDITVDGEAILTLKRALALFKVIPGLYAAEHSLEVQLPFLQSTVADFKLIPLIIGEMTGASIKEVANVLFAQKGLLGASTLVVVSSDFVHQGPSYGYQPVKKHILDGIRQIDSQVVRAVAAQDLNQFNEVIQRTGATVCGQGPLRLLLALLNQGALGRQLESRLEPHLESWLACYYTSAQRERTRGGMNQDINVNVLMGDCPDAEAQNSVSYVSMIFTTPQRVSLPLIDRLTAYEKRALLKLARTSITNEFVVTDAKKTSELLLPLASEGLMMPAGAFVTLTTKTLNTAGDLRGCIGRITTHEPLFLTVQKVAREAAFSDSRFSPVRAKELSAIAIDISVLEQPVKVASWKDIVIGKHGILLSKGFSQAVFLPQVATEQGWDLKTTLQHLSVKAGLERDAWQKDATFQVFEGCEFKE